MKHKYLVTFYKYNRVSKFICTRTYSSVVKFALKNWLKKGLFTIKRLDYGKKK